MQPLIVGGPPPAVARGGYVPYTPPPGVQGVGLNLPIAQGYAHPAPGAQMHRRASEAAFRAHGMLDPHAGPPMQRHGSDVALPHLLYRARPAPVDGFLTPRRMSAQAVAPGPAGPTTPTMKSVKRMFAVGPAPAAQQRGQSPPAAQQGHSPTAAQQNGAGSPANHHRWEAPAATLRRVPPARSPVKVVRAAAAAVQSPARPARAAEKDPGSPTARARSPVKVLRAGEVLRAREVLSPARVRPAAYCQPQAAARVQGAAATPSSPVNARPVRPAPVRRSSSFRGMSVDELLSKDSKEAVSEVIREQFRQHAGIKQSVSLPEVTRLVKFLAAELGVDIASFGELDWAFRRYDFSGDGHLQEKEFQMLVEGLLRHCRTVKTPTFAGCSGSQIIPNKRLDSEYILGKRVGEGGQGAVHLAQYKKNGQQRVVKFYDKSSANAPLDEIVAEFELLTTLDHPNIARVYDIFQDPVNFYVAGEPYFGGDLVSAAEKAQQQGVELTFSWFSNLWKQAGDGIAYLHTKHVMHCDIKEQNVMLVNETNMNAPNVVVIDFGISKGFTSAGKYEAGTPGYMPPEVWRSGMWTPKGDSFSFAVMMYRMVAGRLPFGEGVTTLEEMKRETLQFVAPTPDSNLAAAPALWELVVQMLKPNPLERPTMAQVLKAPWFSQGFEQPLGSGSVKHLQGISRRSSFHIALLTDLATRENLAQLEDLYGLFKTLDTDKDGELDEQEVRQGLAAKMTAREIDRLIPLLLRNGKVAYTEFMAQMIAQKQNNSTQLLWQIFQEADVNHDNVLELDEIVELLKRPAVVTAIGGHVKAEDVMKRMHGSLTGGVTWEQFRKFVVDSYENSAHSQSRFQVGDNVKYWSETHDVAFETTITRIDSLSGAVKIQHKPGHWLDLEEQASKLANAEPPARNAGTTAVYKPKPSVPKDIRS
eukprot:TRINITY_DN32489_c0_g1_i1.p1 TRINITY_DN32489_c0_g1~~TRINITY_DN32489_c0_g1_i1.p1  ORF type:complete len:927 (+),score=185.54 TRINITY_DN32489_c0_g1_i1:99-2879(+)